ncbi:MAG: exodeoxyribonuclease VII large subunit [Clostridia bacterium]|nr:exodeoxyribonuclease VII large subunit [Clostridia bacterium]
MHIDPKTAVFTVGQINEYVKYLIEDSPVLDSVYVVGEISNLTAYHTSGHLYFSLKDDGGVVRAVMFRSSAQKLKFRPENGMRVIVHGRMTVYTPQGQYQLSCDSMEPDGLGSLAAAYEQLKNRLAAEGLFDQSRKKELPTFPKTVGVITSPTGAAIRDIINVLQRRSPQTKILLFPTLVQGEGASRQLCSGIRYFNTYRTADVIIIGRGGGSIEELWAFNDETLARTVADSQIPVISAVGHETDFTICDFAADLRAPTPSAAAELAVPDNVALTQKLSMLRDALDSSIRARLRANAASLSAIADKHVLKDPERFLQRKQMDLDASTARLAAAAQRRLSTAHKILDPLSLSLHNAVQNRLQVGRSCLVTSVASLEALNPLSVLTRGYSAAFDTQGTCIRSVNDVDIGERIQLKMKDGWIDADVTDIHPNQNDPPIYHQE